MRCPRPVHAVHLALLAAACRSAPVPETPPIDAAEPTIGLVDPPAPATGDLQVVCSLELPHLAVSAPLAVPPSLRVPLVFETAGLTGATQDGATLPATGTRYATSVDLRAQLLATPLTDLGAPRVMLAPGPVFAFTAADRPPISGALAIQLSAGRPAQLLELLYAPLASDHGVAGVDATGPVLVVTDEAFFASDAAFDPMRVREFGRVALATGARRRIGTCDYASVDTPTTTVTVPLDAVDLDVTVYQAATGKVLAHRAFRSDRACPQMRVMTDAQAVLAAPLAEIRAWAAKLR
ncbi:MAG: hypothetical protein K8W52_27785 [Deltaproteobacteria bacterium]|nr:hypothetical protein [Deltaproteobacteria bacterium]